MDDRIPRMTGWLVLSIVLAAIVYGTMPMDPEPSRWARFLVMLNKLNLVTLAGWVGYWVDRRATPYARPDTFARSCDLNADLPNAIIYAASMLRRALIMGACMLAVGLGS